MKILLVAVALFLAPMQAFALTPQDLCDVLIWQREWRALKRAELKQRDLIKKEEVKRLNDAAGAEIEARVSSLFDKHGTTRVNDLAVRVAGLSGSPRDGIKLTVALPQCSRVYIDALFGSSSAGHARYRSEYNRFRPVLSELKRGAAVLVSGVLMARNTYEQSSFKELFTNRDTDASLFLTIKVSDLNKQ